MQTVKMRSKNPKAKDMPLGELLVSRRAITEEHLAIALQKQKEQRERIRNFDLSEYIVANGLVTDEKLLEIENKYKRNQRVGEAFVAEGTITEQELETALEEKKKSEFLGETLLRLGYVDKPELYTHLKRKFSIPSFKAILIEENIVSEEKLRPIIQENQHPQTLGEILVDLKYISAIELHKVLKENNKRMRIGDMLVNAGLVSAAQLDLVLEKQKFTKLPIGDLLISDMLITDVELYGFLAKQNGLKFKLITDEDLLFLNIKALTKIIGKKESLRYHVAPIKIDSRKLELTIFDPNDIDKISSYDSIRNLELAIFLIRPIDFNAVFRQLYGEQPDFEEVHDQFEQLVKDTFAFTSGHKEQATKSKYVVEDIDKEAENLANLLLSYGIKLGASDIHLEHDFKGVHVRYRVDGILHELKDPQIKVRLREKSSAIVSRLKILANLNIAERRLPQDGSFRLSAAAGKQGPGITMDFRLATNRGEFGENVVLRIIDSRKANVRLDQLGHSHDILIDMIDMLKSSSGIVLVTGPTGSGKTSTLYAALNYIAASEVKVVTAEDPIEFKVPGIMQAQINPKIGLTYSRMLKSFLRMDPDIILLGEVRDEETAEIAIESALTGHMILSTLHTSDAIGAISRLRDLGASNLQIETALKGVLSQRLVRAICVHCKRPHMPDKNEWIRFFDDEPVHLNFFLGEGCIRCNNTGYSGRLSISELLTVDTDICHVVLDNGSEHDIYQAAKKNNMRTIAEDGLTKLDRTTLAELIRVLPTESLRRYKNENSIRSAKFPKYKIPELSVLEYQTIISKTHKGYSKTSVGDIYNKFRHLRHRLSEPTEDMTLDNFSEFICKKLDKCNGNGNGNGSDSPAFSRVSILKKGGRSMIAVETLSSLL